MKKLRRRSTLLPTWNMPSDPVKAVFWFLHWTVKVLARYFWLPIIAGVVVESIMNRVVGGIVTLLVGLAVWGGLAVLLLVFNVIAGVTRTVSDLNDLRQGTMPPRMFGRYSEQDVDSGKVVEGTITDLDEERRKRRKEL